MRFIDKLIRGREAIASTVRLWLIFLACAMVAMLWIAALRHVESALSPAPPPIANATAKPTPGPGAMLGMVDRAPLPRVEFQPTFADAAQSVRTGRFAEAYGRFVNLADDGDSDAGRIALVMHRYGPELFGSTWDASTEQLAQWTRWSEAAAQQELASRPGAH